MKVGLKLLASIDDCWAVCSKTWKKAHAKASEKSIHDLRVSMRRLSAALEVTQAVSKMPKIPQLQRRLKKVLKSMGPLRDLQVQLDGVSEMRQQPLILEFRRSLEKREKRRIAGIAKDLKRSTRQKLAKSCQRLETDFAAKLDKLDDEQIRSRVERIVKLRRNCLAKALKQFKPADGETLHEMRIALKKLRYGLEAAAPVVGPSARTEARQMHTQQQLLGDARDAELLHSKLAAWAAKRGCTIAIVPALEMLLEKQRTILEKVVQQITAFEPLSPAGNLTPAAEKTVATAGSTEAPTTLVN